ncbi:MAG: hypothetical protein PVG56_13845 [Anaerolineae bacterium]|jgi:hypothetical protein
MTEEQRRQRGEKPEKQEEKEEKSWDEKWRRDPLSAAVWALILIWAGAVLLAGNVGLLAWLPLEAWSLFFLGAGAILLLEAGFRLLSPSYRQPVIGTVIIGVVFFAVGLAGTVAWRCILPLAVVGVGVYLLLRVFLGRRE